MADYSHSAAVRAAEVKEELAPELAQHVTYEGSLNRHGGVQKVSYSHEDMVDAILANPRITNNELAIRYGYTPGWVSRIISSDAFKLFYAKRRNEIVDPLILAETEERFRSVLDRSLDLIQEKIEVANLDGLVKTVEVTQRALGYGVAKGNQVNIQNSFVVALPEKAQSSESWEAKYGSSPVIEVAAK